MTPTPTPAPRIAPAPFIPAPSNTTPEGNRIVLTVTLVETVTAVDGKHRMLMGRDGEGAREQPRAEDRVALPDAVAVRGGGVPRVWREDGDRVTLELDLAVCSRDFDAEASSFQVPFYFLEDDRKGLTGGVTAGWRSDTRAITMAVFIGAALDLVSVERKP